MLTWNRVCSHGTFHNVIYLAYVSHVPVWYMTDIYLSWTIHIHHGIYVLFVFKNFEHGIRPAPTPTHLTCQRTILQTKSMDAPVKFLDFLCMDGDKQCVPVHNFASLKKNCLIRKLYAERRCLPWDIAAERRCLTWDIPVI